MTDLNSTFFRTYTLSNQRNFELAYTTIRELWFFVKVNSYIQMTEEWTVNPVLTVGWGWVWIGIAGWHEHKGYDKYTLTIYKDKDCSIKLTPDEIKELDSLFELFTNDETLTKKYIENKISYIEQCIERLNSEKTLHENALKNWTKVPVLEFFEALMAIFSFSMITAMVTFLLTNGSKVWLNHYYQWAVFLIVIIFGSMVFIWKDKETIENIIENKDEEIKEKNNMIELLKSI